MQEPNNSGCKILDKMAAEDGKEDSFLLNISLFLSLSGLIRIFNPHDHFYVVALSQIFLPRGVSVSIKT